MTVWPASFFFWGASGICRRLQPSPFDSPNQPARTRVVSVWNTTQAPPTIYLGTGTPSTGTSVASPRGEEGFYRHFGTATLPTGTSEASPRGEEGSYRHFGTGTLPTGTSETSPRGEEGFYRHFGTGTPSTDASVASSRGEAFFLPVFGTATLPTDVSVASLRSHCEFVYRIAALLGFVKFTWHEPLLIIN